MEMKSYILGLLCCIQFFIGFCFSDKAPDFSFVTEATSAPEVSYYDYIVIGGGTTGCPLAATLSEGSRVLLLERGGSPYSDPNKVDIDNVLQNILDISSNSFSQQFISSDGVINTRARVLGGGTVLNAGFYSRAEPSFVEEAGWNKTLLLESYQWIEKGIVFEPQIGQWQSAFKAGLLEVGVSPDNGFTYDHIPGTKIGGTILDKEGHRHTSADLLEYADPSRISVYLHAIVQKILFKDNNKGTTRPQACGVLFKDANGDMHRALLSEEGKNEIILSAGAVGSPQILMLSGIGPEKHLQEHGIDTVLDNPLVGQGMADNPMHLVVIPSPEAVEQSLVQVAGITETNYIEGISGVKFFGITFPEKFREILEMIESQASMEWLPHEATEIEMKNISLGFDVALKGGGIVAKVRAPLSTGHLELKNTDPDDNPSVTFNYFKEPQDLQNCVEGMKIVIDVINSESFSKFRHDHVPVQALFGLMSLLPLNLRAKHLNDAFSLERFCMDTVLTIYHFHGGCQTDKVVDRDYRVLGVDGLRVTDASTFHSSPGTNPQATIMMLGRYVGRNMLLERSTHLRQ